MRQKVEIVKIVKKVEKLRKVELQVVLSSTDQLEYLNLAKFKIYYYILIYSFIFSKLELFFPVEARRLRFNL